METTSEKQGRILLVDDESAILRTFRYCLEDEGYSVATASSAPQAEALLQRQVFDLCFLDLRLGEDNGLDVLAQMRVQAPWMRVVIVTAHSAVDTAVDAMQAGAVDYLVKPCSPDQLRLAAAKQLEVRQLTARLEALEDEVRRQGDGLESHSPAMAAVLETARQVAATDANILILGESGSGKGELARAIHTWSKRAKKPQVTINCPSLTAELMESELFGHSRGAFTGATESTLGRVSQADGGALLQRLAAVRGRLSLCADQAAAAKWWLSMPMASVSAEGPMPKALSTRRTSPLMPGCRHQGRACPLRRARMTSNPLIVA